MKILSNKSFNKVLNMMAANSKGLTPERLSVILDADREESVDAYFFGRLVGVDIVNEDKLLNLLRENTERYMLQGEELQSVKFQRVEIVSVAKIAIYYSYTRARADREVVTRNTYIKVLATDDEIDGIFDFVYKD